MHRSLLRIISLGIIALFLTTGCMLSRGVDRAFIGWTNGGHPHFAARQGTGLALLPLAFTIDVVTLPIQGLLIIIFGDNFPYKDAAYEITSLKNHPLYQRLSDEQKALALVELKKLLLSGAVSPNTALALGEDGHWVLVHITDDVRAKLFARAQVLAFAQ